MLLPALKHSLLRMHSYAPLQTLANHLLLFTQFFLLPAHAQTHTKLRTLASMTYTCSPLAIFFCQHMHRLTRSCTRLHVNTYMHTSYICLHQYIHHTSIHKYTHSPLATRFWCRCVPQRWAPKPPWLRSCAWWSMPRWPRPLCRHSQIAWQLCLCPLWSACRC